MGWGVRRLWRKMSHEDRVDLVDALLRNRALMLDERGRPLSDASLSERMASVGANVGGGYADPDVRAAFVLLLRRIIPSDEEFRSRANDIVDATGKDQVAALVLINAFGDEMGERLRREVEELEEFGRERRSRVQPAEEESEVPSPRCRSCGKPNPVTRDRCSQCGRSLPGGVPEPPMPPPPPADP